MRGSSSSSSVTVQPLPSACSKPVTASMGFPNSSSTCSRARPTSSGGDSCFFVSATEAVEELLLQRFVGCLVDLSALERRLGVGQLSAAPPLEDERRVVRPALGEPFTDGFPERDTGIDRRLGAVRGAKRPQLSTDLGEHRLLVRALQGELAGRLVPFEQLLDLRQREQLERLFAAFEHVSEAGRQHDCLHVQLLDDVRMCEEVPAGRLHWAFVEVGDDGRATLRSDEEDPLLREPLFHLAGPCDAVEVEPAHRSLLPLRERLPERSSSSSSSPPRPPRPIFSLIASMPPSTAPFVLLSAISSPPFPNWSGTPLA